MNPKVCPVCGGRGDVPIDLYEGEVGSDWEPGDIPFINPERGLTECRTCEGLGLVWPPQNTFKGGIASVQGDEDGCFTYFGEDSQVFVSTTSTINYTNLYDWDEAIAPSPSLKLVGDDDSSDN